MRRFASLEAARKRCLSVTAKVAEEKEKEGAELSGLAKDLKALWGKYSFSCQTVHVGQLLHMLLKAETGEDLPFKPCNSGGRDFTYPLFSAVVPLEPRGRHGYPIGKPFMVTHKDADNGRGGDSFRIDGRGRGNWLCGAWRYATAAEIEELFVAYAKDEDFLAEAIKGSK